MGSAEVLGVGPRPDGGGAFVRRGVGSRVGSFAQRGLDGALGLAVGARGVAPRSDVASSGLLEGGGEQSGVIGRALSVMTNSADATPCRFSQSRALRRKAVVSC